MNKYTKLFHDVKISHETFHKEYKLVPSRAVINDHIYVNKKTGAVLRKRELKGGTLMYDILKS